MNCARSSFDSNPYNFLPSSVVRALLLSLLQMNFPTRLFQSHCKQKSQIHATLSLFDLFYSVFDLLTRTALPHSVGYTYDLKLKLRHQSPSLHSRSILAQNLKAASLNRLSTCAW